MARLNDLTRQLRLALCYTAFCSLAALGASVGEAAAQGRTAGSTNGTVGGGATGASNRGGAGGISNPSPGGEPASAGGPAQSSGPQGNVSSRPGYLGGRTTSPVVPPPPVLPPGTIKSITTVVVAQFGKCAQSHASSMPQERLAGSNVGRIDTVAQYLLQGRPDQSMLTARNLLADMQAELEKPTPDLTLAGTYLGIVSGLPVTPALVTEVSGSLCAPLSTANARAVSEIAEAQRAKLLIGR